MTRVSERFAAHFALIGLQIHMTQVVEGHVCAFEESLVAGSAVWVAQQALVLRDGALSTENPELLVSLARQHHQTYIA